MLVVHRGHREIAQQVHGGGLDVLIPVGLSRGRREGVDADKVAVNQDADSQGSGAGADVDVHILAPQRLEGIVRQLVQPDIIANLHSLAELLDVRADGGLQRGDNLGPAVVGIQINRDTPVCGLGHPFQVLPELIRRQAHICTEAPRLLLHDEPEVIDQGLLIEVAVLRRLERENLLQLGEVLHKGFPGLLERREGHKAHVSRSVLHEVNRVPVVIAGYAQFVVCELLDGLFVHRRVLLDVLREHHAVIRVVLLPDKGHNPGHQQHGSKPVNVGAHVLLQPGEQLSPGLR